MFTAAQLTSPWAAHADCRAWRPCRSYLGYGLMAGRAAVLGEESARGGHPCVPAGYSGKYEYGGQTLEMKATAVRCKQQQHTQAQFAQSAGRGLLSSLPLTRHRHLFALAGGR